MTATVTLSMEVELAWGFHDILDSFPHFSSDREEETKKLSQVLNVCDKHSIPFSFDIVGYLLNREYRPIEDSPHDQDWLPVSPGSDVDAKPLFYAPDLAERIREASTNHEICSHTYTHTILGEASDDVVEWELQATKEAHERFGLEPPTSLVPPRHSEPATSLLLDAGFSVMRSAVTPRMSNNVKQFLHLLTRSAPVEPPKMCDGVLSTYCTRNPSLTAPFVQNGQDSAHPTFRVIPKRARKRIHRRFLMSSLEKAIKNDSHVHYWTHLFNLSNDVQWLLIRDFLEEIHRRQEQGEIEVVTMKELAERVRR